MESSTTGAVDTPATNGGDRDGWGTDFITRWHNDTGHAVRLVTADGVQARKLMLVK